VISIILTRALFHAPLKVIEEFY